MGTDNLTEYGAGVLAQQIEAYWRERGFRGVRVERYELPGLKEVFGLRSNIGLNGFPPRQEVSP